MVRFTAKTSTFYDVAMSSSRGELISKTGSSRLKGWQAPYVGNLFSKPTVASSRYADLRERDAFWRIASEL